MKFYRLKHIDLRVSFRMKCLLCQYENNEKKKIKEHYLKHHNVDENNSFFKKLIDQKNNLFYGKKCNYCNEFVLNKPNHDFLKHYGKGLSIDDNGDGNDNLDKPINIIDTPSIRKFEITFREHSSFYDFFDSVAVVDSFLAQVKNVIQNYKDNVLVRAGFSIENVQQPLDNYSEPLVQTRYWTTEPIQTKSLNNFVSFKIREQILRRVINNKLSGSAWNFNKFNYINVKILNVSDQMMR